MAIAGLLLLPFLVPLPTDARDELRAILTEALAETDPRAQARIAERAKALQDGVRFESALEALREGPLLGPDALEPRKGEELARFDEVVVGYAFESGGATYRYALHLPARYEPDTAHALLLDPGHGSASDGTDETRAEMLGMYRRHADSAGFDDWIVARTEIVEAIGAGGRRGALPDDWVALVFQDFFRDVATRVRLDPDRIRVTGVSQTGYWTWYLGRFRADRFAGIAPMSAIARVPADAYLANFLALPVHVLHGDRDPTCSVDEPRATCARLAVLGAPVVYREIEGGAHDYAVWRHQPQALEWLAERPRDPYPRRVSKSLQTALDGWCYWIRVDALEKEGDGRAWTPPTAGVDAELDGQTVRVYSQGVERLTVCLSSAMLDLDQPVRIEWNGAVVHDGRVERSLATAVLLAADKVDWTGLFEATVELRR